MKVTNLSVKNYIESLIRKNATYKEIKQSVLKKFDKSISNNLIIKYKRDIGRTKMERFCREIELLLLKHKKITVENWIEIREKYVGRSKYFYKTFEPSVHEIRRDKIYNGAVVRLLKKNQRWWVEWIVNFGLNTMDVNDESDYLKKFKISSEN